MNKREMLEISLLAGEILLSSGSEIYRVEETMSRMCKSYGYNCEIYVTPSGIFMTCSGGGDNEVVTHIKRIKQQALDLHRIQLVNSFARKIENSPVTYDESLKVLKDIKSLQYFKFPTRLICSGLTAFSLGILFKGNFFDGCIAGIISMCIYIFNSMISKVGNFQFLQLFISGLLAGGTSLAASNIFTGVHSDKITLGAIMVLLPGLSLTNGIKDALYGDIVSSVARIGDAIYTVAALGAGVAAVFYL